jgi:hypothetical protein
MPSQVSIDRHILIQVRQHLFRARRVPPIPHQIAHNRKKTVHLHARTRHLIIRRISHELRSRTRCFDVGEDGIAGGAQGQGEEGGADIGGYAGEDDLFFTRGFNGGTELWVIPCTEWVS